MYYYLIELNYLSGGIGRFIFLREENAKRCFEDYIMQAETQAHAVGGTVTKTGNSIHFEWNGPLGIIRWSVSLTRLGTADHLWENKVTTI